VLDVPDRLVEQVSDVVVVEVVHDVAAVAAAHDEAEVAKEPQLMGDGGGVHLDRRGQLGDGPGAGAKPAEDAHPARGGERLHRVGDGAREIGVEAVGRPERSVAHASSIAVRPFRCSGQRMVRAGAA
jgi:hypothetical protein